MRQSTGHIRLHQRTTEQYLPQLPFPLENSIKALLILSLRSRKSSGS